MSRIVKILMNESKVQESDLKLRLPDGIYFFLNNQNLFFELILLKKIMNVNDIEHITTNKKSNFVKLLSCYERKMHLFMKE